MRYMREPDAARNSRTRVPRRSGGRTGFPKAFLFRIMNSMERSLAWRYFLIGFLAVIVITGLVPPVRSARQLFPLSSWLIFSLVPGTVQEFAVRIRGYGESTVSPPLFFAEAGSIVPDPHSVKAFEQIQRFGRSVDENRPDAERMRIVFERNFLPRGVEYELVRIRYRPLERYRNTGYSIEPLGTFSTLRD